MRAPLHAIAPSQSALRYLRQILFPRPYDYRPTMAANCARVHHHHPWGGRGLFRQQRGFHGGALGAVGEARGPENTVVIPHQYPPVPPAERVLLRDSASAPNQTKLWNARWKKTRWKKARIKFRRKKKIYSPTAWAFDSSRLINQKRLNEVVNKWIDAKEKRADEKDVQKLGITLMKAFNRNRRSRGTPHIFNLMAATDPKSIDTACLNLCMEAYLLNNRPSKLIEVYRKYQGSVKPNYVTINIILRNFIAMGQLSEAENLLKVVMELRGPVTRHSFQLLMYGVRAITDSLPEMTRVFEWMKTTHLSPHSPIYNTMIKTALDCSQYDLAKKYADEMVEKGLGYNLETFVLFLSTQSKAGDWDAVAKTMQRMKDYNIKLTVKAFNTLLHSYARAADLPLVERFFESMLSFDIVPDRYSYNILIHASCRAKDEEAKHRWLKRMRSAGHLPDVVTFNILFHELRKTKTQPYVLRRIYNAVLDINPDLVNTMTKMMLLDSMFKDSLAYERRANLRRTSPRLDDDIFLPEIKEMESATNAGRPHDAICIFTDILAQGLKPTEFLTTSAVRAAFRLPPPEHDNVSRLLYIAHKRGARINDIVLSILSSESFHSSSPSSSPEQLNTVLQQLHASYSFMSSHCLPINHYIFVKTAWKLATSGDPHGAIFLMNKISTSQWGSKWNVVGLTTLLHAYTLIRDLKGMRWVVETMEAEQEMPDRLFMRYLRRAKEVSESQEDEAFISWLVVRCVKHREALKEREADDKAREILQFFEGLEGKPKIVLKKRDTQGGGRRQY